MLKSNGGGAERDTADPAAPVEVRTKKYFFSPADSTMAGRLKRSAVFTLAAVLGTLYRVTTGANQVVDRPLRKQKEKK